MTTTNFTFGSSCDLTVTYCDINEYIVVELTSGGRTYFDGYADDVTDIWSPEARALEVVGHKHAAQFTLRRMLSGDYLSKIADRRFDRFRRFNSNESRYELFADVTYYARGVHGAYATHTAGQVTS